jgi:hypothetical protein
MPISFACECGKGLRGKEELADKRIKCPSCGRTLRVPNPAPKAGEQSLEELAASVLNEGPSVHQAPIVPIRSMPQAPHIAHAPNRQVSTPVHPDIGPISFTTPNEELNQVRGGVGCFVIVIAMVATLAFVENVLHMQGVLRGVVLLAACILIVYVVGFLFWSGVQVETLCTRCREPAAIRVATASWSGGMGVGIVEWSYRHNCVNCEKLTCMVEGCGQRATKRHSYEIDYGGIKTHKALHNDYWLCMEHSSEIGSIASRHDLILLLTKAIPLFALLALVVFANYRWPNWVQGQGQRIETDTVAVVAVGVVMAVIAAVIGGGMFWRSQIRESQPQKKKEFATEYDSRGERKHDTEWF